MRTVAALGLADAACVFQELLELIDSHTKQQVLNENFMAMHAHRANGAWLEGAALAAPHVHDAAHAGSAVHMYTDQLVTYIKEGKLCVHVRPRDCGTGHHAWANGLPAGCTLAFILPLPSIYAHDTSLSEDSSTSTEGSSLR